MLAPLGSDTRVEGNTHGHWIWQRNTVFPGLDFVSFARTAIALDSKAGKIGFKSLDVCDIAITKDGLRSRELPSDELYRKAAAENDAGSLRIYPDVVFGGRRYVSSGRFDSARARFVSGAKVTTTIPGFVSTASMIASAACTWPAALRGGG